MTMKVTSLLHIRHVQLYQYKMLNSKLTGRPEIRDSVLNWEQVFSAYWQTEAQTYLVNIRQRTAWDYDINKGFQQKQ